jgi:Ca2+-binding RTX toxin-like protein
MRLKTRLERAAFATCAPLLIAVLVACTSRPGVVWDAITQSFLYNDVKLLVPGFAFNDFGDTHSLVLIVDSLSVQNTLARLDPTVSQATLESLLRGASNARSSTSSGSQGQAEFDTLERVVRSLGDITGASRTSEWHAMNPNPTGGTWAQRADEGVYTGRDTLHNNLRAITTSAAFTALAGTVQVAPTHTASAARNDFAALLSLTSGATFSLCLDDTSPNSPALIALGAAHSDAFSAWLDDRDAIAQGRDQSALNFTDTYLSDRAELLNAIARRNQVDYAGPSIGHPNIRADRVVDYRYEDDFSGQSAMLSVYYASADRPHQLVTFGSNQPNALTGTDETRFGDHLYGGAGNDTITGLDGADHLEGNADHDTLDGGTGADTLLGGTGNDTLEGGADNDRLLGGADNDTYRFAATAWGADEIIDSDGQGRIEWNGGNLPQGLRVPGFEGVWQSADGRVRYTRVAAEPGPGGVARDDLVITLDGRSDQRITIRDWNEGARNLGITFGDAPPAPEVNRTVSGDVIKEQQLDGDGNPTGTYAFADNGGYIDFRIYAGSTPQADAQDILNGSSGNDDIRGLGGNDGLAGGNGDDLIAGGEGDDLILGGTGADSLTGGAGNDVILGSALSDVRTPTTVGSERESVPAGWEAFTQGFSWSTLRRPGPRISSDNRLNLHVSGIAGASASVAWLEGDQVLVETSVNVIDGGAGSDFIVAGTGDDYPFGELPGIGPTAIVGEGDTARDSPLPTLALHADVQLLLGASSRLRAARSGTNRIGDVRSANGSLWRFRA